MRSPLSKSSTCRLRSLGVTTAPSAVRRESKPQFYNRLWVADLAPLPVFDHPYFLCVVLDAYSRRCHGWHFSGRLNPELVESAVSAAVRDCWPYPFRPTLARPVALALGTRCGAAGVAPRTQMGPGDVAEATAADFFHWLDADLIASTGWPNKEQARRAIQDWIVQYYNEAASVTVRSAGLAAPDDGERRSA